MKNNINFEKIKFVEGKINVLWFRSIWRYYDPMLSRVHLKDRYQYTLNYNRQDIGFVQIDNIDGASIQMCILPKYHNKGIGTKTIQKIIDITQHTYITWYVYNSNYPSLTLLEKFRGGIDDISNENYYRGYILTGKQPTLETEEKGANIALHRKQLQDIKPLVNQNYQEWLKEFKTRKYEKA